MQLILTKKVAGLGGAGDLVEVKEGYARNFLLPRKLAITGTASAQKQAENIRTAAAQREARAHDRAEELKAKLAEVGKVAVPARAGNTGKLFGSVTPAQVAAAISNAAGSQVDAGDVRLAAHQIRSLGQYEIEVDLGAGLTSKVKLDIVAAQ
ncbi:ribosomal protein L9 [Segniliparus rotundus DSM 44985]|uniref:Large ribosomal subunit protein bL9 n=1 Tax=Segniliparus rotundus (strain ATCC BAA-972 / CDC 1076 / CIP 108378 / DSM 44985 / JCM 13578) TaxID=640132 RepID=D6ZB11_SEGRD|nr:50S ribosomal protein L9 [Segniliparus rotundus]ADG96770.1 ribosomal protein L9 [Segniliparus rotundus DSM 44985]